MEPIRSSIATKADTQATSSWMGHRHTGRDRDPTGDESERSFEWIPRCVGAPKTARSVGIPLGGRRGDGAAAGGGCRYVVLIGRRPVRTHRSTAPRPRPAWDWLHSCDRGKRGAAEVPVWGLARLGPARCASPALDALGLVSSTGRSGVSRPRVSSSSRSREEASPERGPQRPQQRLYFLSLPQGHGALRPMWVERAGAGKCSDIVSLATTFIRARRCRSLSGSGWRWR